MLLVDVDHLLDFVIAAQKDTAAIVDVFRDDCEHSSHLAVNCLAASYS